MSKTNSNSITSILVHALNNRKSGFKSYIIGEFNKKIDDFNKSTNNKYKPISENVVFSDGTYTTLPLKEMGNKKIDIYGMNKADLQIMIEVKANLNETLQKSQTEEYIDAAINNCIPLVYIIPDGYNHEDDLKKIKDKKSSNLIMIVYWSTIYDIAKKTDSTGLDYQIENFVELIDKDSVLNKNEMAVLFTPCLIADTLGKINILLKKIKDILGWTDKKTPQNNQYGIGYDYKGDANYWIGLVPTNDERFFFSLAIAATKKPSFNNYNDVYYDGTYFYVPYDSNNAKEIGDTIEKNIISNLINSIDKDNDLKNWLNEPKKRIIEIKAIYGLSAKIQKLVKEFLIKNEINDIGDPQNNENQIGYYFDNGNKFLGISPKEKSTNSFSLAVYNNNKKIYDFFPLSAKEELFYKFLLSETQEEQQNNFNELANKVLKSANFL